MLPHRPCLRSCTNRIRREALLFCRVGQFTGNSASLISAWNAWRGIAQAGVVAGRSPGGHLTADSFDAARRLRAANEEPEMSDHHGALTARSSVALVGVADDSVPKFDS